VWVVEWWRIPMVVGLATGMVGQVAVGEQARMVGPAVRATAMARVSVAVVAWAVVTLARAVRAMAMAQVLVVVAARAVVTLARTVVPALAVVTRMAQAPCISRFVATSPASWRPSS
jgi:hypothetical protein